MDGLGDNGIWISVNGYQLNNMKFADDIDLIEKRQDTLQANINTLYTAGETAGLRINIGKTMSLVFGKQDNWGADEGGQHLIGRLNAFEISVFLSTVM